MKIAKICAGDLAWACAPAQAHAETWPNKPIHWIVPYPPGGGTDLMARVLAAQLEKTLGQPIVVENRPGGSTVTGTAVLAKAAAGRIHGRHGVRFAGDQRRRSGRRYLVRSGARFRADHQAGLRAARLHRQLRSRSPMKTLPELVAYSKSASRLVHLRLARPRQPARDRLPLVQVDVEDGRARGAVQGRQPGACRTSSPGRSRACSSASRSPTQYIKDGTLHALAVTSPKRLASAPDMPTIAEQGYPEYDFVTFYGLAAPKSTPHDIVERLNKEINRALALRRTCARGWSRSVPSWSAAHRRSSAIS